MDMGWVEKIISPPNLIFEVIQPNKNLVGLETRLFNCFKGRQDGGRPLFEK